MTSKAHVTEMHQPAPEQKDAIDFNYQVLRMLKVAKALEEVQTGSVTIAGEFQGCTVEFKVLPPAKPEVPVEAPQPGDMKDEKAV